MPDDSFLPELRTQRATYWAPSGRTGYGMPTYAEPATLLVRWSDMTELFVNKMGQESRSRALVHVGIDLADDGYLFLGESEAEDPATVAGALPIQRFDKIPGLEAEVFVRKAYL